MSFRERLLNIARAELSAAQRRFFPRVEPDDAFDFAGPGHEPPASAHSPDLDPLMAAYRDLELRPGASVEDAKQAYRRLMKRYHPDLFAEPTEKAAATRLVQGLRAAYDRIEAHERTRKDR